MGCGRGSNVAMWTGKEFVYIDRKYQEYVVKHCDRYGDGTAFGCFLPLKEINSEQYPTIHEVDRGEMK